MTMNRRSIYIVVNEGTSERTYLQSLRSFLANRMPLGDDFCPRLDLIPRVTNGGIGGGAFPLVRKTYRMCRQADRHTPIVIWVDADIYVRKATADERHNAEAYSKKGSLPDFCFSVMNFEDFLALHFDDDLFDQWYDAVAATGHFGMPLLGDVYARVFAPIWALQISRLGLPIVEYAKGDLPVDFISVATVGNMMRHASDTRMQTLFRANTSSQTFAEFLTNCLRELYPETFGGVNPLWFGSVNVDNDISHDMESIRKSIAQGLDSDSDGD